MGTIVRLDRRENVYRLALWAISALYFIFGFLTCLNDILVPHLKGLFALSYAKAALVQFSFFTAYFLMSLPSGWLVDRFGYRQGMVGGLVTAAGGCLLIYPAAGVRSYPLFLFALFVLASGITLLQVAANPYVALLGRPETASSRLTLTQGFNSLGTTVAPLFGSLLILASAVPAAPQTGPALAAHRLAEAGAVQGPYLGLAASLLVLAACTALLRLPVLGAQAAEGHGPTGSGSSRPLALLRERPLILGAIGIFMYVGAEVAIGSFLVNYLSLPSIGGFSMVVAARYIAVYWGGAMVGRFLGAAVMRVVPPGRVLAFNALAAVILLLTALVAGGRIAMVAILAVGLFNSVMFPTIFILAIKGREHRLGQASGLLCMAIVGGAVVPVLLGLLADGWGMRIAFLLPAFCYAYIAYYGAWGHRGSVPAPARKGGEGAFRGADASVWEEVKEADS